MAEAKRSITVEQLLSGEPIPSEAIMSAPTRLNRTQMIAIGVVKRDLDKARAAVAEVMRECGLDPELTWDITPEGVATRR